MTDTVNLGLPFIEGSQAQKHVTHNEALRILDAAIQIAVLDRTLTAPPSTPADNERHIVAADATGAWSGQANAIATWQDGAWAFVVPKAGWCVWSAADAAIFVYDGAVWGEASGSAGSVGLLGVNTMASTPNLLSVKSNAALFAAVDVADGGTGDMRMQLAKESSTNTASVFFSDNYSGRAEFGLVGGDSFRLKVSTDGSNWCDALVVDPASGGVTFPHGVANLMRGHISGLTLSTAGASSTFSIAAGLAADGGGVDMLALPLALAKTTSAWSAGSGNGALDTGSIANATWYHMHLIKRPDTGVVEALISLSATTPTLPTNYTLSRRIGAIRTDGSAKWMKFIQDGDVFTWDVPTADFTAVINPGTSAILRALSVPPGINVTAIFHARCYTTTAASATATIFSDPAATDTAPDFNNAQQIGNTTLSPFVNLRIRTDTARQIRVRSNFSDSGVGFTLVTEGWIDPRGK